MRHFRIIRRYSMRQEKLFEKYKDRHFATFIGGTGGCGAQSFARDKWTAYGGPDGGNGGNGGDVWLIADETVENLYKLKDYYRGLNGDFGYNHFKDGKSAKKMYVSVPVGTLVRSQDGKIVADLAHDGSEFMVAAGGAGGLGNAFFCSPENKTPRETTPGNLGESTVLELELRKLSNLGLVGLPNAGKSSLLNILSRAQSDVSMIAGTTLVPHIGTLVYNDRFQLSIADLPGIEPANVPFYFNTSSRAGQFLQHCSRCQSLVYVLDGDPEIPFTLGEQFSIIRQHLAEYDDQIYDELREIQLAKSMFQDRFANVGIELSQELNESLTDLPFIVLVSKSDLQPDQAQIDELAKTLQIVAESKTSNLYYPKPLLTSAENHDGWASLIYIARHLYENISGKRTDDLYW